jgi:PKD repeat protein
MQAREWVVFLLLLGLCAGCAGSSAVTPVPQPGSRSSAATPRVRPDADTAWRQLIARQQSGQGQFNPQQILVVYRDPGQLAPLAPRPQAPAGLAASMPNPSLRQNRQYEAVSDAIVVDCGLSLRQQVYRGTLNLASFDLPAGVDAQQALSRIRQQFSGQVAYALLSPRRAKHYAPNDPDYASGWIGPLWDRWQIHCGSGWDITLGEDSVWIAVVDTGVRVTHEELVAQVINPASALPAAHCDVVNNDNTVEDLDGHGTFIAGVIAAEANNGRTLVGVAPHCRVLPVKISNDGYADTADIVAGCLLAGDLGARVVNLSFGGDELVPSEEQMVDQLTADGVLFVGSAGNDGQYYASYPAAFDNALCVGSTDFDDWCTDFSNWGLEVDLAAPGLDLKSCGFSSNSAYETGGQGTSYSAPMVAAAAGLLWSYDPTLTRAEVRDALEHHGAPAWNFAELIVRLDLVAAFGAVIEPVTPTVAGLSVAEGGLWGAVPARNQLAVQLIGAQNVKLASYTLDLPPYNADEGEDLLLECEAAPLFAVQFGVPASGNATARLRAEVLSPTNTAGTPLSVTQYIFNQRGDVNCDGAVNLLDSAAYGLMLGLHSGDAGYLPFFDSDLDGTISESDAGAVGYFFNGLLPAPQVSAVSPQTGFTGQEVTLSADVMGAEPLTYAWDFGGGAVPNSSPDIAPVVVLGAEGSYSAALTLTNVYGETTYDFTLNVTPRPGPIASFTATPRNGPPPLAVEFDARDSSAADGGIVNYQWSWDGDATWEHESASPAAAHTFATLGTYTVLLRVTDEQGLTGDATQTVRVADAPDYQNWEEYELGPWGMTVSDDNIRIAQAMVAGRTAVIWMDRQSWSDETFRLAWAKNSAPLSAAEWSITSLPGSSVSEPFSVAECGGAFTCAYKDGGKLYYAEWDGSAFNPTEVLDFYSTPNFRYVALEEINGKPGMIFYAALSGETQAEMHYARATAAHPTAPSDWVVTLVSQTACQFEYPYNHNVQLVAVDGKPYACGMGYDDQVNHVATMIYADSASPLATQWHGYQFEDPSEFDRMVYMFSHASTPALAWISDVHGLTFSISQPALPTSSADWASYSFVEGRGSLGPCIEIDAVPVLFCSISETGPLVPTLLIATSTQPTDNTMWLSYPLPEAGYSGARTLAIHDGFPALIAVDTGASGTTQVIYRYPY